MGNCFAVTNGRVWSSESVWRWFGASTNGSMGDGVRRLIVLRRIVLMFLRKANWLRDVVFWVACY